MTLNPLFSRLESYCKKHALFTSGNRIIIGLSGGPDSVFLLYFFKYMQAAHHLTLIAAHLDHQWRADSTADVSFCQALCDRLEIPFMTTKLDQLPALISRGSQEDVGRRARRLFFQDIAQKQNADVIALAHHADDQQETFFIRLARGTSLSGLVGIQPRNGLYIRPLLAIRKKEMLAWLDQNTISYLTDPSNESNNYLRNRIRNAGLPTLRSCDARFDDNFFACLDRLQQAHEFIEQSARTTLKSITNTAGPDGQPAIDIARLLSLHQVLLSTILIEWLISNRVPFTPTQAFLSEIMRFLANTKAKTHNMNPGWRLVKNKNLMYIQREYTALK